jgi:uncharacterized membrane protein
MKESILQFIQGLGISPEFAVLMLATLPIFELRGSMPVGILVLDLPVMRTAFYSVVGNMIPVVPILLLFEPAYSALARVPALDRFFQWLINRTRRKGKIIESLKLVGLAVFVGVPLPGTGAWAGCVAAFLFRIPFLQALLAIFAGVVMACVIVALVIQGVLYLPDIFGLPHR